MLARSRAFIVGRHPKNNVRLTDAEIDRAFRGRWDDEYPPVLTVPQAAALAGVSIKSIYDWSHRGLLLHCARRKGKRLRIFRDRFVRFLFED